MGLIAAAAPLAGDKYAARQGNPIACTLFAGAERACALVLLVGLAPLLALAAALVALLSRDSPLVAHGRVGLNGRQIWVLKLRTMWGGSTSGSGGSKLVHRLGEEPVPERKLGRDPRVTSTFAAFCRRYSIDELPQLWQVVRGQMSLVGPRPLTVAELRAWYGDCAAEVLSVRPGITGLWQVRGRNSLTYRQRRALDLFLVRRWSPGLYLSILAATVPAVVSGWNTG